MGDTAVAVGAPLGLSNSVTTGIVSALNRSIEVASSALPDNATQQPDSEGEQGDSGNPFQFDIPGMGQHADQWVAFPNAEQVDQAVFDLMVAGRVLDNGDVPGDGVGLAAVQGARLAGASVLIASDPLPERRAAALKFGATHAIDPVTEDLPGTVMRLTGGIGTRLSRLIRDHAARQFGPGAAPARLMLDGRCVSPAWCRISGTCLCCSDRP